MPSLIDTQHTCFTKRWYLAIAIDTIANLGEPFKAMGGSPLGPHGVSPVERDRLEKYNAQFGTSAFNVSRVYELNAATVDYERLCSSWDRALARHNILRSRFINHTGGIRIYQSNPTRTEFVKGLDVRELINHEFDLEKECPVRITISPRYLVICISHIVCDFNHLALPFGRAFRVLFRLFARCAHQQI